MVGERDSVTAPDCWVHRVNWVSVAPPVGPIRAEVQVRYRSQGVAATIVPIGGESGDSSKERLGQRVKVVFDDPQFGVTPGQAAVWYDASGRVLGGGIIEPICSSAALTKTSAEASMAD